MTTGSMPAEWINGDDYPNGIPYNTVLSNYDQVLIEQLYGPPSQVAGNK